MNYNERTQEIFNRADRLKKQKRKRFLRGVTGVGLSAAVLAGVLFLPYPNGGVPSVSKYKDSEYYPLIKTLNGVLNSSANKNNWEALTEGLFWPGVDYNENFTNVGVDEFYPNAGANGPAGVVGAAPNAGADGPAGSSSSNGDYVETTDNQVSGIIEGDLMKRSDKYIYYLSSSVKEDFTEEEKAKSEGYEGTQMTCELIVYSVAGEASQKVGSYTVQSEEGYPFCYYYTAEQMYLSEDCNTVTLVVSAYDTAAKQTRTAIVPLDVSDVGNITQGDISYVSGTHVSSRLADGTLLLVCNFTVNKNVDYSNEAGYVPQAGKKGEMQSLPMEEIILPENANSARYTLVCTFDGEVITSHTAFLSYATNAYVSAQNIYVTRQCSKDNETVTEISRVDYSTGKLVYKGSASVKGSVLNQYSMDEKESVLRVVTTTGKGILTSASLFCVDINTFETVASLENFAPEGETVHSVRFDGNTVNVCTAVQLTDPVFIIDLTDLNDITVKDTGEISGFSTSLRTFKDGTLLGIGYGDSWSFKVELYKESADGVVSVAKYEANCDFSTLYKSYFIDAENGYIGLCVFGYENGESGSFYLLLKYDGEQLVEVGMIPMQTQRQAIVRACLAEEYLYIVSDKDFIVTQP